MIAADTSALLDFVKGNASRAASLLEKYLGEGSVVLPEPVLFEILSGPRMTEEAEETILVIPRLVVLPGYWERAGAMRRKLLKKKTRARAMDCLVAQICIDHRVPLITGDQDFRRFDSFGLQLVQ